jgi:hypothetical protein
MRFRVTSSTLAPRECEIVVYIPEIGRPVLDCNITRRIDETDDDFYLNFVDDIGDYEGYPSGSGFNYFELTAHVQNIGEAKANSVAARITALDGGAILIDGEEPTKPVNPEDLIVNGVGSVSWKFRPIRQADDAVRRFEVTILSDNAEQTSCIYELTIQGAPRFVKVSLPLDAVGQFGDKIAVPIMVSPTIGRDANVYKLNIRYNPEVVRYISATNDRTATSLGGWSGPRSKLFKVNGSELDNLVRIEDLTTGSPLSSKSDEVLAYLIFEGVYGGDETTQLLNAADSLVFVREFNDGTNVYKSSMNSTIDSSNGNISLEYGNGFITVSGACILPLNSSLKFQLAQNKPNPFNPSTVIEYTVGFDSHVKLEIFDALGRHVRTLVDEYRKAGEYRQVFDASDLPSGTYLYKLESPRFTDIKRMVLTR